MRKPGLDSRRPIRGCVADFAVPMIVILRAQQMLSFDHGTREIKLAFHFIVPGKVRYTVWYVHFKLVLVAIGLILMWR